jgi:hypothetical protein
LENSPARPDGRMTSCWRSLLQMRTTVVLVLVPYEVSVPSEGGSPFVLLSAFGGAVMPSHFRAVSRRITESTGTSVLVLASVPVNTGTNERWCDRSKSTGMYFSPNLKF